MKSKELCSGQSVSISCVDNLHEADITSDGSGVDFTAEVGPHNEPGTVPCAPVSCVVFQSCTRILNFYAAR